MQAVKIVVTGAYSAGKTHFVRAISDIDVLSTETAVTNEEELQLKSETTVALDFGTVAINDDVTLYLFGTPGQERFDFMWEVLATGCIGYIVLVDSCRPAHLNDTRRLMARFSELLDVPYIVAATKQDDPSAMPPAYIRRRLGVPPEIPVLPCVSYERESVKQVLLVLFDLIVQATAE